MRILSKVVFLKVILVVHTFLKLVTTLMNDLLAIFLVSSLGYPLILNFLLLLMNLLRGRRVSHYLLVK